MEIMVKEVPIMFPDVFKARAFDSGGTPYYSVTIPIVPGSDNHKAILAAIDAAAELSYGAKFKASLASLTKTDRVFFRESEKTNASTGEVIAGFEDLHWLKSSRAEDAGPPSVFNGALVTIGPKDGKIRSGVICNVMIDVWAQKGESRRVNARLLGIQYLKAGESFGGGAVSSADAFPVYAVEEEDESESID